MPADYIDDLPEETQEQLLAKTAQMRAALLVSRVAVRPYPLSLALKLQSLIIRLEEGGSLTEEERALLMSTLYKPEG